MDNNENIDSLCKGLMDIVLEYESLDKIEPFTPKAFKDIKDIITNLHQSSALTTEALFKQIYSLKHQKDELIEIYDRNTLKLDENLKIRLKAIKKKYEGLINSLNLEINKNKEQNELKKEEAKQEIEFYFRASLQHVEMFLQDYKDSENRYGYQYSQARESYGKNIIYYNNILTNSLEDLKREHLKSLKDYDDETRDMISLYNDRIAEESNALELLNKEYKERLSDFKVIKRNETEDLNNNIRSLADNKNQQLEDIKARFSKMSVERTANRELAIQDSTLKNQTIIKNFVYNMDRLEALLNQQRAKYLHDKDSEIELYYEAKLALHKAQEKEILALNNFIYSEKELKNKFKKINKDYNDTYLENEKNHKRIIERLDTEFEIANENNAYQKRRLDIDRTSSIKSLNHEEIKDNKHFQEENNHQEDEMSYLIGDANFNYNIEANNIRLSSNNRMLNLQKDISILDAKHQKDVKRINNRIRNNKLEIDFASEANRLTHEFEELKYNKRVNYLTVSNLLEIEKCKVLNTYNFRQYGLNKLNAKLLLNYSKEKFNLQDEKYEALTMHSLKLKDKELALLSNNTAFRIQEHTTTEEKDYQIENQNKTYGVDVLSHNVLVNRFKLNIKSLNQALSAYILLVNKLEENINRIVSYILTNLEFKYETYPIIEGFISRLARESLGYHIELIRMYERISTGVIDNHLQFEEEFKFKTVITQIKEKYNYDINYLNGEIEKYNIIINDNEDRIENISSRVSRLELTNSFSNDNKKHKSKATIKKNKKTIKKLNILVANMENQDEQYKKKIKSLKVKLEAVHNNFISDMNQIKRLQYNSAQAYHILKDSIKEVTVSMISNIQVEITKASTLKFAIGEYTSNILRAQEEFKAFSEEQIKKLYNILHVFCVSNDKNLQASRSKISAENNASNKKIKLAALAKIESAKESFSRTDLALKADIDSLKREHSQIEADYLDRERRQKESYDASLLNIRESLQDAQATFFTELYAICDNKKDIEEGYKNDILKEEKSFEAKKALILEKNIQSKKEFQEKLNKYIANRNLLIKNLPLDLKEKKLSNNEENKERNKEIEAEKQNARAILLEKRKDSRKALAQIDNAFSESIYKVEAERKRLISKEKHKYTSTVKKLR